MPPNSLAGASSHSKTMIPNTLLKQQRRFLKLKNEQFLTWPSQSPDLNPTELFICFRKNLRGLAHKISLS
ncbi:hypothetical protein LDENG_00045330 [Lucifuga dentata]|nr:hypothetical protein LDENG_00045330 [Lucifuga dentata]